MMNEFVRLSEELFLMAAYVLNTVDDTNTIKSKGCMKKQNTKGSLLKILDSIYI